MKKNSEFLLKTMTLLILTLSTIGQYVEAKQQDKEDDKAFCSYLGFTEASVEQIIRIKEPFVVKKVCGTVLRSDNVPMGTEVVFEIRKKDINWKTQKVYKTTTDEKGYFYFKGVKRGTYCFKVTLEGWQSVMGEIILTNKADKNSRILVKMEPGF